MHSESFGYYIWMSLGAVLQPTTEWIHHNSLIYSPVAGHLVYFQFLAITNRAAKRITSPCMFPFFLGKHL